MTRSGLAAGTAALALASALSFAPGGAAAKPAGPLTAKVIADGGALAEQTARGCRGAKRRRPCRRSLVRRKPAPADRLVDLGPGPLPGLPGPPSGPPGGEDPPPGGPPPPLPRYVSATTTEFDIALSRSLVGAGVVRVELRNKGEDPHDLVVAREAGGAPLHTFPEHDPETYSDAEIALGAGRYRLFCSLPGHAGFGMEATLRVE